MSTEQEPHPFWRSEAFKNILERARQRALRKQQTAPTPTREESLRIINRLIDRIENKNKP